MLDYYLFALYVFVLLCVIVILCKYLFADRKRQQKMLEEKEEKLLRTYSTLEDAMDEFYDLVAESKEELTLKFKALELRADGAPAKTQPPEPEEKKPAAKRPSKPRTKKPKEENQPAFEQLFNETTAKAGAPLSPTHESILKMSREGRSCADIAKELQITQNEVDLVIGMHKTAENMEQQES